MSEDISKGKKKRKGGIRERVNYHVHLNEPPTGAHAAAEGHVEALQRKPDQTKGAAEMAAAGNPADVPDFGSRRAGSSREVAYGHPDLRNSSTDFNTVLSRIRMVRGSTIDLGGKETDQTPGGYSHAAGEIALRLYDAANEAGGLARGMRGTVQHDPGNRAEYESAPIGASNGTHDCSSQAGAVSRNPQSAGQFKASDRLAIMKETMRVIT